MLLEGRIDPLIDEASARRRAHYEEKVGRAHPVQPVAGFFETEPERPCAAGSNWLGSGKAMRLHGTRSLCCGNARH